MGKVSLPVEDAVTKSSEGGFWLNLEDCKSGKVMVSTEFSGTKTLRTVTKRTTESTSRKESSKTETIVGSSSVSSEHQSKAGEQEPVPTIGKGDHGDDIQAENKKEPSKKETTVSRKDDDDGAQGLKSSLMNDDKNEKKENVSSSAVLEVATSTVTKVIEDAQKKVAEDTTIKTSMEDDTKSDPKGNKEIIAETDNKAGKEKQLDWKDDEDGAEGLKSKLLEDKRDAVVDVMTVAKETVTKVIEDANEKQDSTVAKGDEAIPNTTIGETSSKEAALNWRDDKGGVKGLKATLLEEKAEEEGAAGNEALISAAKETVTKVIEDAKQKVSGGESSRTVSTEGKIETDIKVKGEEGTKSTNKEEKPEQTLNWRDDKDGAKGLKAMLEKEDSNKSAQGETEIDTMTTFVGTLKIKIHEAKDLEKKDLVQKADPYVVVRFGSQESKSEKVKNSLSPVWNYETALDLQRSSPRMIEIQLMDWERIGKDEPMGKVLLSVSEAVKKSDSVWMDLQDCKSGKILISTEFSGSDAKAVIGGGVKELRDMLKSDKNNTESDEQGSTLQPKDGLNPIKTENDEDE